MRTRCVAQACYSNQLLEEVIALWDGMGNGGAAFEMK